MHDKVRFLVYDVLVPDLDRLPRGLRPAWRAVADALRGQQPPPIVGDAIEKALARTIRLAGGLRWVPDLAEAVVACHTEGSLSQMEAVTAALEPTQVTGVGSAFVEAAWSFAATNGPHGDGASMLDGLVRAGLERMVDKLCVGPLEPDLVPAVFSSVRGLLSYVEKCLEEVQLANLAGQMTRTGCTGHIRAPRTRLSRPGTKGLLYEPIG